MAVDANWEADLSRYPKWPFFKEQSIWAIWLYRFGRRVDSRSPTLVKKLLLKVYWVLFRVIETLTVISFSKSVQIGPGLKIHHFGNIFIHPDVVIGSNCTLRHGVTIGNRTLDGKAPVIGDNVEFGAYAQVLGDVRVGNSCKIGAMSVVVHDVPDGCTVVGVPAKVVGVSSKR